MKVKAPAWGPRMTVMGELSRMGLTPGREGWIFCLLGSVLCVCVCVWSGFWSGFCFELCVLQ